MGCLSSKPDRDADRLFADSSSSSSSSKSQGYQGVSSKDVNNVNNRKLGKDPSSIHSGEGDLVISGQNQVTYYGATPEGGDPDPLAPPPSSHHDDPSSVPPPKFQSALPPAPDTPREMEPPEHGGYPPGSSFSNSHLIDISSENTFSLNNPLPPPPPVEDVNDNSSNIDPFEPDPLPELPQTKYSIPKPLPADLTPSFNPLMDVDNLQSLEEEESSIGKIQLEEDLLSLHPNHDELSPRKTPQDHISHDESFLETIVDNEVLDQEEHQALLKLKAAANVGTLSDTLEPQSDSHIENDSKPLRLTAQLNQEELAAQRALDSFSKNGTDDADADDADDDQDDVDNVDDDDIDSLIAAADEDFDLSESDEDSSNSQTDPTPVLLDEQPTHSSSHASLDDHTLQVLAKTKWRPVSNEFDVLQPISDNTETQSTDSPQDEETHDLQSLDEGFSEDDVQDNSTKSSDQSISIPEFSVTPSFSPPLPISGEIEAQKSPLTANSSDLKQSANPEFSWTQQASRSNRKSSLNIDAMKTRAKSRPSGRNRRHRPTSVMQLKANRSKIALSQDQVEQEIGSKPSSSSSSSNSTDSVPKSLRSSLRPQTSMGFGNIFAGGGVAKLKKTRHSTILNK